MSTFNVLEFLQQLFGILQIRGDREHIVHVLSLQAAYFLHQFIVLMFRFGPLFVILK